MAGNNTSLAASGSRATATRQRVIEAAERLLSRGSAEFSMRELAAEAGVSFATPFNQFGNKTAIMHALSEQRIGAMAQRFADAKPQGDAVDRIFVAVEIAVDVMLAKPKVNRAVIGSLGTPCGEPGQVCAHSRALWAEALGNGDGIRPDVVDLARSMLPDQLAIAFGGVLSFWTAGEIGDAELPISTRSAAASMMLGFVRAGRHEAVLAILKAADSGRARVLHKTLR